MGKAPPWHGGFASSECRARGGRTRAERGVESKEVGICLIEHFVHKVRRSPSSPAPLYSPDRVFRYGNPTQMPTPLLERHAGFAKTFVETFAPEILKVYVQQVELYVTQKAWLSRKVIYKIVQFLTEW